ncbi:hypothetical protein MBLNU459_g8024t1 [Dothideomycetes sp. NU459]
MALDFDLSDTSNRRTFKDLPPIQTGFINKPLPPIIQTGDESPPRLTRYASMRTPSISISAAQPVVGRSNAKTTLFSLFSRPKVEKLRGYNEPGLTVPLQDPVSRGGSPDLIIQVPSPLASEFPPPRPSTALSFRTTASVKPSRKDRSRSRERASHDAWTPPPLFQVYTQSFKASVAQTLEPEGISSLRIATTSSFTRADKPHRHGSVGSVGYSALPKKVFALCKSGHVVQYADKGLSERMPEKVLQLTEDSAAYACDLVPGRPYALQIAQTADDHGVPVTSSSSLLSRMGLKNNSPRREVSTMVLVLDNADDMNGWMIAVREQIRRLDGNVTSAPAKKDGRSGSAQTQPHSQRTQVQDRTRQLSMQGGSRVRASVGVVTNASDTNSRPLKNSYTSRPRRASDVSSPSAGSTFYNQVETATVKENATNTATPKDSPMSSSPHDPAVTAEQVRKQFPFKIRSAIPEVTTPYVATPERSPPGSLEKGSISAAVNFPAPSLVDDKPRPDSFVADLPLLMQSRALRGRVSSASMSRTASGLTPSRGPEPLKPRRSGSTPLNLPLRINPSFTTHPSSQGPVSASSTSNSSAGRTSEEKPLDRSPPSSTTVSPRNPRRTPSVKLSLFPSPSPPPSAGPGSVRPVPTAPTVDTSNDAERPLRRPASLQVRPNPAPFLQSVSRSISATRPPLEHSTSMQSLRHALTTDKSHHVPTNTSTNRTVRRLHSDRNEINDSDLTALPMPPPAKRGKTRANVRSPPLPALDLGIPIIGLGPPAPPPDRSLPLPPPMMGHAVAV